MSSSSKDSETGTSYAISHDTLIKKIMENPLAAREFLEEFLPKSFLEKVDLMTISPEKESFVESHLKQKLSDVILSMKTKSGDTAYAYVLLEHQSTSDYWMAFRLWRYTLALLERHAKKKNKLPLVCPLVLYNGKRKYTAPKSFWELFDSPEQAKDLMGDAYQLVDLQSMKDDEINYEKHISMILYLMKHVHMRDMFKLVENLFKNCERAITLDKYNDNIYIRYMICYTDGKVEIDKKKEFEHFVLDKLSVDDKEGEFMRTIADYYVDVGREEGIEEGVLKTALNMIKEGVATRVIAKCTGLSETKISNLTKQANLFS